jgi:hypothetical protein
LVPQGLEDPRQPPPPFIGQYGQDEQADNAQESEQDPGEVIALVGHAETDAHPEQEATRQRQERAEEGGGSRQEDSCNNQPDPG